MGAVEIALSVVLVVQVRRARLSSAWLWALTAFFLLRGADRLLFGAAGVQAAGASLALDLALLAVLVLLLLGVDQTLRAARVAHEAAQYREREYARAIDDYRHLIRHRIANPIAAIVGSALTVRDVENLDEPRRLELLDSIVAEALRMVDMSTEPQTESPEELPLQPLPRLQHRRANGGQPDSG